MTEEESEERRENVIRSHEQIYSERVKESMR